jgi:hypothetical protein
MANRIKEKIRKLEMLRDNLDKEANVIISKHKKDIVRLNINQMIDGYGNDNADLFNKQKRYKGIYALGYGKTGLYDFFETGAFIQGLFAEVSNNGIIIDSKGKGTGDKLFFFNEYTNLFGLNDDSMKKLRDIILPELRAYLKSKL